MIILASQSPRRSELLRALGVEFKAVSPLGEEEKYKGGKAYEYCMKLAENKARSIHIENDDDIIIAADTIVYLDDKVLGKPKDEKEAKAMLKSLSGKEHKVYTGYMIRSKKKALTGVCRTKVSFRELSDDVIDSYVESGEPMGKAGAYAIQGMGSLLVSEISGDYDNVVGLPVSEIFHELRKHFGYDYFKEHKAKQ